MSTLPRRQYGIVVTIALAVVTAAIAGVVLLTSSRASEVNLTTASLVPADAGLYVAFNTDLSSSQWVSAFKLVQRLGVEDPEKQLRDGARDGGVDWEKDVSPFLGGNAAIYLRGFSIEDVSVQGAAIVRCNNPARALEVVKQQAGVDFQAERYGGVEYFNGQGMLVAKLGEHLVLAMDLDSMDEVIDVWKGKKPALSASEDFKKLRDELTGNFLGFVYMDAGSLADGMFNGDAELKDALRTSGAGDLALKPGAAVIGAKSESFEFQAAAAGEAGSVSPMLAPRTPKFAAMVPADASIFVSTTHVAQTWKEIRTRSKSDLDQYFREQTKYSDLDDALRSAGKEIGLQNMEELINLFTGEMSVAAWFTSTNQEDAEVALLADVDDMANARKVLDAIVAAAPRTNPTTEKVGGVDLTLFTDEDGQQLGYALKDGYLVFGTARAARSVLAKDFGPNLAGAANYQKAVKQMPTSLGSFAYFDLATLLRLSEGGIPAELDKAEQALRGAIFNMVEDRGLARVSGVVTIAEK